MFERLKEILKIIFGPPVCPICGGEGSKYIPGGYCVDCDIRRMDMQAEILSRHKADLENMDPEASGKVIDNFLRN